MNFQAFVAFSNPNFLNNFKSKKKRATTLSHNLSPSSSLPCPKLRSTNHTIFFIITLKKIFVIPPIIYNSYCIFGYICLYLFLVTTQQQHFLSISILTKYCLFYPECERLQVV